MRPDIAQAIHDAAVSGQLDGLDRAARIILSDAFISIVDWAAARRSSRRYGFWGWLVSDEGRTYMLLVAEALS